MRAAVWSFLHSRPFSLVISVLIILNVLAVILVSVPSLQVYADIFWVFEVFSVVVFTIEYIARLFSCTADDRYQTPIGGRIRFALTPMALIDLLAVLPFYLALTADLRFLRALRILRLARLAKLGRYSDAFSLLGAVLRSRKEELLMTTGVMVLLLIVASCLMFQVEHTAQPDKFPDIPSTMWWAVATMTTVGYGDIYPITGAGKIIGSVVAFLGIGFFALPAGILGGAFVQEIENRKSGE